MSHDTAGTDSDVVADGHTGQDHRPSADPNTIADFYRSRLRTAKSKLTLFPRQSKPFSKIRRMERRVNLNRRVNECVITDFYTIVVKKNTVEVDFAMISEKNIFPVIAKKGAVIHTFPPKPPSSCLSTDSFAFKSAEERPLYCLIRSLARCQRSSSSGSPQSYNSPAGIFSRSVISFSPIRCFYFTPAGEKINKKAEPRLRLLN